MNDFFRALEFTLQWEGGISHHPSDYGGLTNTGITQTTYSGYLRQNGKPDRSVREITRSEVEDIYYQIYWEGSHCYLMDFPLNAVVFDTAVNFGVWGGLVFLQEALGVTADGYWGKETLEALKKAGNFETAEKICNTRYRYRMDVVAMNPSQRVFLDGWHSRDKALK